MLKWNYFRIRWYHLPPIVDPGTGQVLASQEMSGKEWMKMQQMHQMMHDNDGGHSGGGMMMGDRGMM